MTAAAVIVLRKKRPDLHRPYRTLGYPVVPFLFVVGATVLVLQTANSRPIQSIQGIVLIAIGIPFYLHWKNKANTRQLRAK